MSNIRVICRFRPINDRERQEGEVSKTNAALDFSDRDTVKVVVAGQKDPQIYTFDNVFWSPTTTQQEVYERAARDTIEDVLKGYNGTIFAYGQTGSGKSFSMFGPDISDNSLRGIIPRAITHIFDAINKDTEGIEYTIKCSFLEIYKEIIRDLLNPKNVNLRVRETPSRGVWVEDLTEQYCTSEEDIFNLLRLGEKFRAVSATSMNSVSSRSHSLFIVTLVQKLPDGSTKQGKLNLADLAGSEKVGKTGAVGETLEEAKKINQSLSALGNVINALTKAKRSHVPYRDSKLTHVLRESLGGNCKTTLLIACSPHKFNVEETISTLKFGQRAKSIKNAALINKQRSVAELTAIINKLTKELEALKKYVVTLEKELSMSKPSDFNVALLRQKVMEEAAKQAQEQAEEDEPQYSRSQPGSRSGSRSGSPTGSIILSGPISMPSTPIKSGYSSLSSSPESKRRGRSRSVSSSPLSPATFSPLPTDSLSLVELQVELEKARESAYMQIQELNEEISSMQVSEEEQRREIEELKEQLNTEQASFNSAKSELETKIAQLQSASTKLEYQLKQASIEVENHLINVKNANQRNKDLETQLTNLKNQAASSASNAEKFSKELQRAEREVQAKASSLQNAEQKAKEMEDKATKMTTENATLQSKKLELELENKNVNEKKLLLEEELKNIHAMYDKTTAMLNKKIEEKDKLEQAYEETRMKLNALEKTLEKMTSELQKGANTDSLQQVFKTQLTDAQASLDNVRKENIVLKKDMAQAKTELEKSILSRQAAEKSLHQEQAKTKSSNEQILKLNREIQDVRTMKDGEVRRLNDQLQKFQVQMNTETKAKQDAEHRSEELSKQLQAKNTEVHNMEDEYNKMKNQLSQIKSTSDVNAKDMEARTQRIHQLEGELASVTEKNMTMAKQIESAAKLYTEMDKRYKEQISYYEEAEKLSKKKKIAAPVNASKGGGFFSLFSNKQSANTTLLRKNIVNPDKEGWLQKQGGLIKTWQKRWYILKDTTLYYFQDDKSQDSRGTIPLDGVTAKEAAGQKRPFCFAVSHATRRQFFLTANSDAEMKEWIAIINQKAAEGVPTTKEE